MFIEKYVCTKFHIVVLVSYIAIYVPVVIIWSEAVYHCLTRTTCLHIVCFEAAITPPSVVALHLLVSEIVI